MVKNNKYFVYPQISLTTNFGDTGTHYNSEFKKHQTNLLLKNKTYNFSSFDESIAIYNKNYEASVFQVQKLNYSLKKFDFECDLYGGVKLEEVKSKYLISIKECRNPIKQFGGDMVPAEMNIILNNQGQFYNLGLTIDFYENDIYYIKREILESNISKVNIRQIKKKAEGRIFNSTPYKIGITIYKYLNIFKIFRLLGLTLIFSL